MTPETAAGLAFLIAVPLLLQLPVSNDSAWQMWLGRQMLHGANLYTELSEVNPPLWFWIAVPLAWVAEASGVGGRSVLLGFFLLALAASLALSMALVRDWPPARRAAFYAAFASATVLASLPIFTQREHFSLIAAIPYVLLCARREQRAAVPATLALAAGLLGAAGFALKPFFILVPVALELWLWRSAPRIRPETLALAACAMLYIAAVPAFEADYLTTLPLIAAAYPYFVAATNAGFVLPTIAVALAAIPLARADGAPAAFLVAALAFFIAFLLQGKGWGYQALPALGLLLIALALRGWGKAVLADGMAVAIAAMILVPSARTYRDDSPLRFPPGSSVAVLSASTRPLWPQVEDRQYVWPLRSMGLWTLPAVDAGAIPPRPLRRQVAEDLRCNPPDYLVIDDNGYRVGMFFAADPETAAILRAYRIERQAAGFQILRRVAPLPAPPGACRRVH